MFKYFFLNSVYGIMLFKKLLNLTKHSLLKSYIKVGMCGRIAQDITLHQRTSTLGHRFAFNNEQAIIGPEMTGKNIQTKTLTV